MPQATYRRFVPCYVDQFQAADYQLVAYVWTGQDLIARFADGRAVNSIYKTVDELLRAGRDNYLERVREVVATDEATRYGRLALVASNFHVQTGNPAELDAVYVYARQAARYAAAALSTR
jgi:hypothetical protein